MSEKRFQAAVAAMQGMISALSGMGEQSDEIYDLALGVIPINAVLFADQLIAELEKTQNPTTPSGVEPERREK